MFFEFFQSINGKKLINGNKIKEWNLSECQQVKVTKGTDLYKIKDDQYIIALSFTIGLTGIELLSFMSGISVYSNVQSFISAFFHFVGFVATLFFMFYRTCTDYIWVIFGVCSFVPFFTEIVTALRICACKRLPAW